MFDNFPLWPVRASTTAGSVDALYIFLVLLSAFMSVAIFIMIMTSQDVIHSFYVPAFRIKQDVIPGRYTTAWFRATRPGTYHLFCAEYCGTQHSGMIGQVVVMEPAQYQAWLTGGAASGSMAANGQSMFLQLGCNTCHRFDTQGRGPDLVGLFGNKVQLEDGRTIAAD